MLQNEFTERTGVQVSANEFAAIHETYLQNDLTKDEFCALWRRMNAHRVKAAKESAKAQSEREKLQSACFNILCKYEARYENNFAARFDVYCFEVMTEREQITLQRIGLNTDKSDFMRRFTLLKSICVLSKTKHTERATEREKKALRHN